MSSTFYLYSAAVSRADGILFPALRQYLFVVCHYKLQMLPFQLDKGIFFEDTQKLLPWAEPLQNLLQVDDPEINSTGDVLKWFNKTCFGGKKVTVTIVKDNYKNSDGQLEFVELEDGQNNPWSLFN